MRMTEAAILRENFLLRLKCDIGYRHWVLLELHKRQTQDEREEKITKWDNRVGFSSADARHLSSLAEKLLKRLQLPAMDERTLLRMLPKYHLQFSQITMVEPPADFLLPRKKGPAMVSSPTPGLQRWVA
jgi:hypothetical protein